MNWKLEKVVQETNHKYLNYFTLVYDITKDDGSHAKNEYYMASRKTIDELRVKTNDYVKPDGVLIALYHIDDKTKEVSVVITTQFRQPLGTYMTSIPAGLIDEGESIYEATKREALEEAGVIIDDIEILANASASSSGMSDEMNSMVLSRVKGFASNNLEEFEDIKTRLVPLKEIKKMLSDRKYNIPMSTKLVMLYLIERFKNNQ